MKNKTLAIQLVLFVVTVITTTLAGAEAMTGRFFFFLPEKDILKFPQDFWQGFEFSIPFLAQMATKSRIGWRIKCLDFG